jgi:hypothetical protein
MDVKSISSMSMFQLILLIVVACASAGVGAAFVLRHYISQYFRTKKHRGRLVAENAELTDAKARLGGVVGELKQDKKEIETALRNVESASSGLIHCIKNAHSYAHQVRDHCGSITHQLARAFEISPKKTPPASKAETVVARLCAELRYTFNYAFHIEINVCVTLMNFDASTQTDPHCQIWENTSTSDYRQCGPIQISKNTRLKEAMTLPPKGYFFCNDLTKLKGYEDSSPDWASRYKSCITAPIRCIKPDERPDYVGFLKVESLDVNRFDETIHVQLVKFLADLIYLTVELNQIANALIETKMPVNPVT